MPEDDWYYSPVSEVTCSCGELLWGYDWWDGWTDGTRQQAECGNCGAVWCVELECQEPLVVGRTRKETT